MPPADFPPTTLDLLESQGEARGEAPALLAPDRDTLTYAALHAIAQDALPPGERRAELAASLEPARRAGAAAPEYVAAASFGQEQLWLLDQTLPDRSVYNETWVDGLTGALDADVLARALGALAARHDALRTRFAVIDGEVRQVVMPPAPFDLPIDDLSSLPPAQRESAARHSAERTITQPFDLERGPPLRARLLRLAPDEHWLAVAVHHIVFDRWSAAIFMRELSQLYAAIERGEPSPLPALPARFADHARWQREHLTPATLERLLAFWQRTLADLPALELPSDRPRPPVASFRGGQFDFEIEEEATAALRALARKERATPFMALLAAFHVLLHRSTGQEDFAVGTPIAGRGREAVSELIGCFANMLVMRADLHGDPSFTELLARVRASALDVYAHSDLPFEKLVERLAPSRDLARNPLFQVSLRFGNTPNPELRLPGIAALRIDGMRTRTAKFDLAFAVCDLATRLTVRIEYAADLFDAPTIERMAGHFLTLLRGILANPSRRVSRLPLLTPAERHRELVEWNDTATALPGDATIASLFAAQVARAPEATAVVRGRERLTYAELDRRANRLAHRLRALGAGPDATVAVLMPRSIEWTIALLGIMKAQAAYVPLDPDLPAERVAFLLADAGARALVVLHPLAGPLLSCDVPTVCLDGEDAALAAMPDTEPPRSSDARALAYVIHTSGSSGEPKGVMIEQRALVNHLLAIQARFAPGPADCVLQTASIAFDQSIWQVLFPLLAGGRVALPELDTVLGGEEITAEIRRHQVTILRIVPTLLATLVEGGGLRACPSLRVVVVAGEVLDRTLAQTFAAQCDAELVNAFGPTEATFVSLLHTVERDAPPGPIPIGRPLGNVRAYVLDRHDQPVPVGVPGELCIAGASVGRGYWNHPELTAAAFARDPFAPGDDTRMYRTGDIVRRRADGNLDFIGRRDRQVKVRGVRIELGEIGPRDPVEASIAVVWTELLGLERVDVRQNFFDAGGHSLLAMRLLARIEQLEGVTLRVRDFFEAPDIASLAQCVVRARTATAPTLGAIARERDRRRNVNAD